ncbi:hypothetical protein FPV16_21015 [Methylobacterium sp. W2]|uniref:hypothetical protein n=1 Tax=Methylobacterium sp. W2 TaxID=2598107 RepID=UPI001D0C8FBE|nr:hypothetical protein [Methylobacterium sp. W2]MCC0808658.1 hypothetical protein [Methylobacterium sp. W2]
MFPLISKRRGHDMEDEGKATAVLEWLKAEGVAQVADAQSLDEFLDANGIDVRSVLENVLIHRLWRTFRLDNEAAVEHLLNLHRPPEYLTDKGVVLSKLARWITAIQQDLEPNENLLAHLSAQARALGTTRVRNAIGDSESLLEAVEGGALLLDGDQVRAEYLDPVPLSTLLASFRKDGHRLWKFRSAFRSPVDVLDRAIAMEWRGFKDGVLDGLLALFEKSDHSLTPVEYLSVFPQALGEASHLARVLRELTRRIRCDDGFQYGSERDDWLEALAGFRCWASGDLRLLACMERPLRDRPGAYLDTVLAAVRDGWNRDRGAAAFGALSLIRGCRLMFAESHALADEAREENCRLSLATLEGGEELLRIADLCADLPLGLRDERHVWSGLTPPIKAHWRKRASAAAGGSRALGDALVAYILAWTSRDAYADVEPIVFELHKQHDRTDLLVALTASGGRLAATRAAYLLDEFDVHPPAQDHISPG